MRERAAMTATAKSGGSRHWLGDLTVGLAIGSVPLVALVVWSSLPLLPHRLRAVSPSGKYLAEATAVRGRQVLTLASVATGETHVLLRKPVGVGTRYVPEAIVWDEGERGFVYAYEERGSNYERRAQGYELLWSPFAREVYFPDTDWARPIVRKLGFPDWYE